MISRMLQMIVRLYQLVLSPLFGGCCRYAPSCSEYAVEALQKHGALKGCYYTAVRLAKCNPWGGSGFDPVPPVTKKTEAHHCASCSNPSNV